MFGFNNWNFYKESRDGFAHDAEGMMRVHHDRGEGAKTPGSPQGRNRYGIFWPVWRLSLVMWHTPHSASQTPNILKTCL